MTTHTTLPDQPDLGDKVNIEPDTQAGLVKLVAQAITDANEQLQGKKVRRWQRAGASHVGLGRCTYCRAEVDTAAKNATASDQLVPHAHGGQPRSENVVLACLSCSSSKRSYDLLAWPKLAEFPHRDEILALRLKAFETCANHLTHHPAMAKLDNILATLQARWALPRVRVYACHSAGKSFIGWTAKRGAPTDFGLARILSKAPGGTLELDGSVVVYSVPEAAFLDLVWTLIEANALVNRLSIDALMAGIDGYDWRHFWPVQLSNLADQRRRRGRRTGSSYRSPDDLSVLPEAPDPTAPAPCRPRQLGTSPKQVRERERHRKVARKQRHHDFLIARAELDKLRAAVARGEVENPSTLEWILMTKEMLAILVKPEGAAPGRPRSGRS